MAEWFRFLPWWAKVYWLLTAQPLALPVPWPRRLRRAAADAWVNAYVKMRAAPHEDSDGRR